MRLTTTFKRVAAAIHAVIGKSRTATRWYFALLGSALRSLPECKMKRQILNSILSAQWVECDLPPRRVRLGTQTSVLLYPHFYEIDFEILVSRNPLYEKEVFSVLETRLANYDAVVEIGANVGLFSLFFAKTLERLGKADSRVFVFEPSRTAYLRLLQNLKLNSVRNVDAFNCAVGAQTGFTDFFEPDGHLTNGSLLADFALKFSSSVQVTRALVLQAELLASLPSRGDRLLIKIDVEGAECQVLAGLGRMIIDNKPDIILEVLPMYQDALNGLGFLREAGYQFFNITDRGLVGCPRFAATHFRDWLLIPGQPAVTNRQLAGQGKN